MNTHCSPALLQSALAGSLPKDDELAFERHLEQCDECSAALEQLAGGSAWIQEAAAELSADELDDELPAANRWSDKWSEIDFTVEHLEPAEEPNTLGRLGGYDVVEIIGHGGMGIVLKAYDRELKRSVAIKVLAPHLAASSLARKRFAREAQAAAAVVHPHVLAIHQVQPSGRLPFLVMPLVAGESLAQRLAARGTLELKEILRIGMQAAAGLGAAHEQGLVHRDVKPANILLEKGVERAVLTDFGLARAADDVALTRYGVIAGTPQYMSPEQARGESLDARSDLFSLGCVLYEMAAGVSPFRADSTLATMRRLIDDAPQSLSSLNPELPPWFVAIVERLLSKKPDDRFGSAKEVSELLEGCLAHVQQPSTVPLPNGIPALSLSPPRERAGVRGRRKLLIALLLLLPLLAGAFLLATGEPSDISGQYTSDEWGNIELKQTATGEYSGTYSDTFDHQPGKIDLKWSRIERRYNGTWRESENRFGDLSVRQVASEIRGAWTTDRASKINPATPALADLVWRRTQIKGSDVMRVLPAPAPSTEAAPSFSTPIAPKPFLWTTQSESGPNALRLRDGSVFTLPKNFTFLQKPTRGMSISEQQKWLDETQMDFAIDYLRESNQWELKLRNVKVAELPGVDGKTISAEAFRDKLATLTWNDSTQRNEPENATTAAEFQSFKFVASKNPLAFETIDGVHGLLIFVGYNEVAGIRNALLRYKLLQVSTVGPTIAQSLTNIAFGKKAFLNLETGEVLQAPTTMGNFDDALVWARAHGADLIACSDGQAHGLRLVDGTALHQADWAATPSTVINDLNNAASELARYKQTMPNIPDPKLLGFSNLWASDRPATYYIKTRGGKYGIVRITKLIDPPGEVEFSYKLLETKNITEKNPGDSAVSAASNSNWSYSPPVSRELSYGQELEMNAVRLRDGKVFTLPQQFTFLDEQPQSMPLEGQQKWLDESDVNFTMGYLRKTDQWQMKLRNVKLTGLPDDSWGSLSAEDLRKKFESLQWQSADQWPVPATETEAHGIQTLVFVTGANPPLTFAFETSDGERGILQFTLFNQFVVRSIGKPPPERPEPDGVPVRDTIIRYKFLQSEGAKQPPNVRGAQRVSPRPDQSNARSESSAAMGSERSPGDLVTSKADWGAVTDGVQLRLQAILNPLRQGDDCPLFIERRADEADTTHHGLASFALDVDGQIYPPRVWVSRKSIPKSVMHPGGDSGTSTSVSAFGTDQGDSTELAPGKHTLVALWLKDSVVAARMIDESATREQIARAVSNAIEIVVMSPAENTGESASPTHDRSNLRANGKTPSARPSRIADSIPWGEIQSGTQLRIGDGGDDRNGDRRILVEQRTVSSTDRPLSGLDSLALEINGQIYLRPSSQTERHNISRAHPLSSGFGLLRNFLGGTPAPGKYTVVALWLKDDVIKADKVDENATREQIARAVSNPIEIVVEATANQSETSAK